MTTTIETLISQGTKDKILQLINKLPVQDCINFYCEYKTRSSNDIFEQKFISNLYNGTEEFAKLIIKKKYDKYSKEELMTIMQDLYIHGSYSLDSSMDNNEERLFYESWFNDADLYELIKQELLNKFYETNKQLNLTKQEEEISLLKENIAINKSRIQRETKKLQEYEEQLAKLLERGEIK